jgi:nicotinate-nucleotide pyrophosphorylase (carboxylating)
LRDLSHLDPFIAAALAEDIGLGDLTSRIIIPEGQNADFVIAARQELIFCGGEIICRVFSAVDHTVSLSSGLTDGDHVEAGAVLLRGSGNARSILAAERTALNLLQHLCGIATLTGSYVGAVRGTKAVILDTRKTLPGLRDLQKYAVRIGGGRNHRMRLDDGVLIKDNHISICGSITNAVAIARRNTPLLTKIEVECDTLEQVKEACSAGADVIMLDNMTPSQLREAVAIVGGRIPLEASGNVSLATIRAIAETGVDFISIGKLTHSVAASDIGLDIELRHK